MHDPHAQRSKGWSGLAFIILIIAAVFAAGNTPAASAGPASLSAYVLAHRGGLLLSAWLSLPAGIFFLWFSVGMRSYLARAGGSDEGLPMYALASGIVATMVGLLQASLLAAMAYVAVQAAPPAISYLWVLVNLIGGPVMFIAVCAFVFACAHSMSRHGSGTPWLAWLGYLAALAAFLATFGMLSNSAWLAPAGAVSLAAMVLFLIWMLCTCVVLIAQASKELAAAT